MSYPGEVRCAVLFGLLAVVACNRDEGKPRISRDRSERPRRIIEPPSGVVRSLPPHAIRAEGVGPFKLNERLDSVLLQLPGGPRITQFDITNVVHRTLIRAEEDTVLIGGADSTGTASFIAVVDPKVARTENGIHVGATRTEIDKAIGAPILEVDRARDPRVRVGDTLRNLRVILDGDRGTAGALVLVSDPRPPAEPSGCTRPISPRGIGACLGTSEAGEVITTTGDDLQIEAPDGARIGALHIDHLVFAAPLRNPVDGRDELMAITRIDEPTQRTWSIQSYRLDGKLARSIEPTPIYQMSSANARWIGGELRDVEIYAELTARADAIEVGGLLTIANGDKIRYVMTLSTSVVPRRHARPAAVGSAGSAAASADPTDAAIAPTTAPKLTPDADPGDGSD